MTALGARRLPVRLIIVIVAALFIVGFVAQLLDNFDIASGGVFPALAWLWKLILGLVLAAGAVYLYFLPALTAKRRKKANYRAIFMLNLLAGWTFVGWVIAMVWATTVDQEAKTG